MTRSLLPEVSNIADDVTASEAANFAYCAKAWHLEHVLGERPSRNASADRDAGTEAHAAHGRRLVGFDRRVRWILVASLLALTAGIALVIAGLAAVEQ